MPSPTILVDTNVIFTGYKSNCWRAFAGAYRVETVQACVIETQTAKQKFSRDKQIDEGALVATLNAVHSVSDEALARVLLKEGSELHYGEQHLWAHALTRSDDWLLCGPDTASMDFGLSLKLRSRLVCFEALLENRSIRPKPSLDAQYTRRWFEHLMTRRVLGNL